MKTFNSSSGFTLIELLIVITIIGILAVALLSTLNPLEQINKAKDAGKKADANELLSAIERYYTDNSYYPWMKYDANGTGSTYTIDSEWTGNADEDGVGVCSSQDLSGITDWTSELASQADTPAAFGTDHVCSFPGLLVVNNELKDAFRHSKAFSGFRAYDDQMYVYKAPASSEVSVCFIPSSQTERNKWNTTLMAFANDLNADPTTLVSKPTGSGGGSNDLELCNKKFSTAPSVWTGASTTCFICLPGQN